MSGQIIESVEEIGGDESGDDGSVLDLVLFVGFLIVCYLLADSFGIINKRATPTEKASATPTATANAAQTTVVVAPAPGISDPGMSDVEIVAGPAPDVQQASIMMHLMSAADSSALISSFERNTKLALPQALTMEKLVDTYDDSVGSDGLVTLSNGASLFEYKLYVAGSAFDLLECLGVINTPPIASPNSQSVTYVLIYKNFLETSAALRYKVACFEQRSFDALCVKFPSVGSFGRSYVHVEGNKQVLESFCKSKTQGSTCATASTVPNASSILHASMPRVTKIGAAYAMYSIAPGAPKQNRTPEKTSPYKLVVSGVSAAVDGEYTEGEPGYDGNVKVGRYYSATKQGAYVWINWGTGAIGGAYGDGGTYGLSFCKAEVDSATSTVRVTCRPFKLVVSGVNPAVNGEYVERETGYDGNVKIGRYYSATKAGEYVWINWGTGVAKAVVGLGTFDLSKCTRTVDNTAAIVRIDCTPAPVPAATTRAPNAATTRAPAPVAAKTSVGSTPTPAVLSDSEAAQIWRAAPDARKAFFVSTSAVASLVGLYSYKEPGVWLKASYDATAECRLRLTGTEAQFYVGNGGPWPCTLSADGTCTSYYVTVNSNLRATSGMWNGARTLQMTWFGGEVITFGPVQLAAGLEMRDVWRSSTVFGNSLTHLYLSESEIPHVGGAHTGADVDGYLLYKYDGTKLVYVAYWSKERRWKWHNLSASCDIVVRKVA